MRAVARLRHLSLGAEQTYAGWNRRLILFHKKRRPREMGADEVRPFLSHPAVEGRVSASARNVAPCALIFLYRDVLRVELPVVDGVVRAKRPARLLVVFSRAEVEALMAKLPGTYRLIAGLLHGSGLRLMGALRTTQVYTHVLNKGGRGVRSPLEK